MMITIPAVLDQGALAAMRTALAAAAWVDGRGTAGFQSGLVKRNQQLAEGGAEAQALGRSVLQALGASSAFAATALPLRVFPPLFNRYAEGMGFGDHIDNAVRQPLGGAPLRTDISATLFLSGPDEYDGGELVVEDTYGSHRAKLPAGSLLLYPASSVHRVEPVTRGARLAAFFWIQSMVRDDARRALLHDLDLALGGLRRRGLEGQAELIALAGVYHNLLRQWAEV